MLKIAGETTIGDDWVYISLTKIAKFPYCAAKSDLCEKSMSPMDFGAAFTILLKGKKSP